MANENTTDFLDVTISLDESDVEVVNDLITDAVVSPIADSEAIAELEPVIENVIEHVVTPENPNTTLGQEVYVHIPLATHKIKGIASFERNDFFVKNGHVSLRTKLPNQIIVNMSIDDNGLLTIFYGDGTEVYYQFPIKFENPIYRKLLTIVGFKKESFVEMVTMVDDVEYHEHWLTLPPNITKFSDADFIASVDEADIINDEDYIINGYRTKNCDVFKSEDGGVLIISDEPFDGRITLLGGAIFEGKYLLPEGGNENDILIKLSDNDYDCGWKPSGEYNPEVSYEDLINAFK